MAKGNPVLIGELLRNLVFNACAYGGGRVRIVAREGRVTIWDHGPGVDEAQMDRLFAPFNRGESDKPGAGLGLAIVRSIAERLGIGVTLRLRRPRPGLVVALSFDA
jgi:signal transduction histidine kinase